MAIEVRSDLQQLAREHGVETAYVDFARTLRRATPDVLRGVLEALDVPTSDPASALREARHTRLSSVLEPVTVAWDGQAALLFQLPREIANGTLEAETALEGGETLRTALPLEATTVIGRRRSGGLDVVTRRLELPQRLLTGYHRATLRIEGGPRAAEGETLILSAPRRSYQPPGLRPQFGVFAPLYALHSRSSLGIGDLGDMRRLLRWVTARGGATVGTLPLLATLLDDPAGVSPYSPASRLAWNELFLDLRALPEFASITAAPASAPAGPLIDYHEAWRLKWPLTAAMAETAFAAPARRAAIEAFARERPEIDAYARFRGTLQQRGRPWREWTRPAALLSEGDVDASAYRAHLYAQFALDEQLRALSSEARAAGGGLYLDLPVGASRAGFDAWRYPEAFADRLDAGAPPDALYAGGQNWQFAPPHPSSLRESGYGYFVESVRNHVRYASLLRVDHVMAMHRMYVIPAGASARDGVYLRYRPDEQWATLSIESHLAQCRVVGEDLGTVPPAVHLAMREHAIGGSYAVEYAVRSRADRALPPAPPLSAASPNTHDMPTFAAWAGGLDIEERVRLGWLTPAEVEVEQRDRERLVAALRTFLGLQQAATYPALLTRVLEYLGESEAAMVLVTLADLWGETGAQNMPGTTLEHPNWRRRLALSIEEIEEDARVAVLLGVLRAARERAVRVLAE